VKVYRDDAGEQTYHLLQAFRQRAAQRDGLFTAPEPVAYLGDLRALVQEEAPGIPLHDILLGEGDPIPVMRQVARALARLHQHDVIPSRCRTREDDLHGLARIQALLEWTCPHLTRAVDQIVAAVAAGLEDTPPEPTHGDLKTDHIWLDGDRVVFIDLDSFAGADPVSDPALFLARLAALPLRFTVSAERARTAALAFVNEYFAHVPRGWRRRLALHYAAATLKVAASFFRQQDPDWAAKMSALMEEASASVAGGIW
jgi:aminoglycoside phosphotransferase (APT) family kinase protein